MRKMKKFFALMLAMIMAMAMTVTAFADEPAHTITITNPQKGITYKAYKLFNVTKAADATADSGYSYYVDTATYNGWGEAFVEVLTDNGVTLTASADGSRYNVSLETGKAAQLAAALKNTTLPMGSVATGSVPEGETVTEETRVVLNVVTDGYFFVTSTLGSLCALNTSAPSQSITDKNSLPSIEKTVREDSNETYGATANLDVIDTASYRLTVNTGTNTGAISTGINADYVITDTLPIGFAADATSVTIANWTKNTDYTATVEDQVLTITLKAAKLSTLAQGTDIVIDYTATMTAANIRVGVANTNKVKLTYNGYETPEVSADVFTYTIGATYDDNGNRTPTFTKVDADNHNKKLSNVTFILSKGTGSDEKYATVSNGFLTSWVNAKESATQIATDGNGNIEVKGLDADTYYLTETATQDGYNLLNGKIKVVVADDGTVTYQLVDKDGNAPAGSTADNEIIVENETGTTLPSTGGIGTTIFYVVGSLLIIGAGIVLVARKRMDKVSR